MKSKAKPQLDAWPTRKLRDIAEIRVSNVDKKVYASEKPVKLCNYMDVYGNEYVTDRIQFMEGSASATEVERFGLNRGDVIITKDSETPDDIGIPAVVLEQITDLVCGYHLALIRPNAKELDSIYLAKQLSTSRVARYFSLHASGSTRYGLPISTIEAVEIPTPPKPEQTKIAEILSTVDRAIEQTEDLIAKQQRVKTGLMQDLLTRGIDEHGNLRSEQTHKFKDSSLGRIPLEWGVTELGTAVSRNKGSVQTGPFGSQLHAEDYKEAGVPIITVEHLLQNRILHENLPLVGDDDYRRLIKYSLCEGDLVFSRVGAIDRCSYVSKYEDGWLFSGRCLRVRSGMGINSKYLSYQLNYDKVRNWILNNSVGTTMACLNTKILSMTPIVLPERNEQDQVAKFIDSISDNICKEIDRKSKLCLIKTALMQDLLTGKKRVNALLEATEV